MFEPPKVVSEEIGKSIVKALPWAVITGTSVVLYIMERRRVDTMLKQNAEREERTNEFNAWLQSENSKLELALENAKINGGES